MIPGSPLVSVIMPCYEQERYVRNALRSALAQDYSPMEVIVIDDASQDHTHEIIEEVCKAYLGPHRIHYGRNSSNERIEIYNRLMREARGQFIVHAHGDDISFPGRVGKLVHRWLDSGASLIASDAIAIDAQGKVLGRLCNPALGVECTLEKILTHVHCPNVFGSTFGYSREIVDRFGPFDRRRSVIRTDVILPFRAALMKGMAFLNEPLMRCRLHNSRAAQLTYRSSRTDLASGEPNQAERVTQLMYLFETLLKAGDDIIGEDQRNQLLRRMTPTLTTETGIFVRMRNTLIAEGWRYRWTKE